MKRVLFILNPIAGSGKSPLLKKLIDSYQGPTGFISETVFTEYAGHASLLTLEAVRNHYYAVVAVGGDGTINEIAGALINSETSLGIIPQGSGNGLARHLKYSLNPEIALQQIFEAKVEMMDSISINNRFSVNVSGLGFDGYVAYLFNHAGKRGLSTYTRVALKAYYSYPSFHVNYADENGSMSCNAHMIVIANGSQFGNKALIAPYAKLNDGIMDVVIVRKPPFYRLASLFYRLFTGSLRDTPYLKTVRCAEFTVTTDRPLHLHIDGETVDMVSSLHVKIHPASLRILIPGS